MPIARLLLLPISLFFSLGNASCVDGGIDSIDGLSEYNDIETNSSQLSSGHYTVFDAWRDQNGEVHNIGGCKLFAAYENTCPSCSPEYQASGVAWATGDEAACVQACKQWASSAGAPGWGVKQWWESKKMIVYPGAGKSFVGQAVGGSYKVRYVCQATTNPNESCFGFGKPSKNAPKGYTYCNL